MFAVKYRQALIQPHWEKQLYQYITGIVQNRRHKMMAVNGMPDHVHIFLSMHPAEPVSVLVQEIKKASSSFIRAEKFTPHRFQWQAGYGAFSYSKSHAQRVVRYVLKQKEHHYKKSFREEYLELLKAFEIEFQTEYLFDFFDVS
uniref:IS200/IS605 family transposase n=1 Tax=Flavilitoribacter nigricans TaxID=70997 RepID=UPI001C9E5B73|nr:IS200/IS605 family transposase [Flavilitoribacter nigricans]